jgi:arylsulfatase A-like enzyme
MGLAENTVVIFTSDNGGVAAGDALQHQTFRCAPGKVTNLKGNPGTLFYQSSGMQGGQKVPLR